MKKGTIFWGIFLISFGILLLIMQFDLTYFSLTFGIDLWPLILIFWGVSLLKIPDIYKKILAGATGLLIALFIAGLIDGANNHFNRVFNIWDNVDNDWSGYADSTLFLSIPYKPDLNESTLNIDLGRSEERRVGKECRYRW